MKHVDILSAIAPSSVMLGNAEATETPARPSATRKNDCGPRDWRDVRAATRGALPFARIRARGGIEGREGQSVSVDASAETRDSQNCSRETLATSQTEIGNDLQPSRSFFVRRHPLRDVSSPPEDIKLGAEAVTVCIAARCGSIIIAASDHMLTAGDVQFESPAPLKIQHLSNLAFIMTSGDAALAAEMVYEIGLPIRERISSEPQNIWRIKDIVDLYIEKYNEIRLKKI
jgi:hypothetical protein